MRLAVVSTMTGLPWGASEELWCGAAGRLLERGHRVAVSVDGASGAAPAWERLRTLGARVDRRTTPTRQRAHRRIDRLLDLAPAFGPLDVWHAGRSARSRSLRPWRRWLRRVSPDLVLVSLGSHRDEPSAARACAAEGIPWALLLHSADPDRWLEGDALERFRTAWLGARATFFVSAANREILERQLAAEIPRSRVVDNPLAVCPTDPLPWPPHTAGLRLACVGRLGCWQKGQDVAIEVLARAHWRERPVTLGFWGEDQGNRRQLEAMVRHHGLDRRVRFEGHTGDPLSIWRRCHGLLLASRYEGMPMVTAEAMLCGRVPIVTECGRNGEWVEDGVTGFLAPACTADLLDAALERAWAARSRWPAIGGRAARRIATTYDCDPITTFADALEGLAGRSPSPSGPPGGSP